MSISDNLTQQKLQDLLLTICEKGNRIEDIDVKEFILEIKNEFLTAISENK
ncbi:hypothetical protein [Bacillus timonensis]|uniref:hypothetical protein n=1 Tax=Bacillus timonensis TaxID=1033734 RepID=UPI0002DBBAB6|nr:hypothetical protein [Bacillus timonensis]